MPCSREVQNISGREWQDNCLEIFTNRFHTQQAIGGIQPLCGVGNKGLYVNSQGKFYPCCWMGLRYEHNKDAFSYIDQDNKSLVEVLDDPNWSLLIKGFQDGSCPRECKEKCTTKKWSLDHATAW